jgi:hypothetical protein
VPDTRPGILAIFNNVAPGREAEFEEWFQHEHLGERLAVPGFLLGRRHEAVSGEPRYFNFYLTQSADVLTSAAYLTRLDHPTPMTRVVMAEIFKDMVRTVCEQTLRLGTMRGAVAVTVRFREQPDEAALEVTLENLMEDNDRGSVASVGGRAFARRRSTHRGLPAGRDATAAGCRADCRRARHALSRRCAWDLSLAVRNQTVGGS